MFSYLSRAAFLVVLALASTVLAEDAFYHMSVADLDITEGALPTPATPGASRFWSTRGRAAYAILDGEGEVYVTYSFTTRRNQGIRERMGAGTIAVRAPRQADVTGKLVLPKWQAEGMQVVSFRIPKGKVEAGDRDRFYELKMSHYEGLLQRGIPGAAWFRHEARQAGKELGKTPAAVTNQRRGRNRTGDLADTYALFTGGRAMSENLQLDRVIQPVTRGEDSVQLSSIKGITVGEIDWEPFLEGVDPELDPLASKIPSDQHALFFPSFKAAETLSDEMSEQGAPIMQLAEPRSTSARTMERYQEQMCLTLTAMGRIVGPAVIKSIAVTGSDPYFRTGTDVAVLFQTDDPDTLEKLIMAQVALAIGNHPSAKPIKGEVEGLAYRGARSEDRAICSYIAKSDGIVVVTNSPFQLEQLVQVLAGKTKSLATLDGYRYFRHRYLRNDEGESAFMFLSDATIRRWCGPHWRIATSRRMRDAAVVAELQASQLERLVQGDVQPGPFYTDLPIGSAGKITLAADGVHCSTIGSLAFMTPIAEMPMEQVSQQESDAYKRWRDRYQSNWRWAFDPIGLRVSVDEKHLAADLTVMPLIWGSDYREMISYSQGASFEPDAGDPHNTLAHVIMAINTKSPAMKRQVNILRVLSPNLTVDPLAWLGDNVSAYVDDDPFWQEMAEVPSDELNDFLIEEGWRMPLAVRADVSSGFKLTAFLVGVRAFIEQSGPGMLNWESKLYKDQPYVKITPSERAIGQTEQIRNLAVYYNASGTSLTLTLNEDVLKRAIDREVAAIAAAKQAKEEGTELPAPERTWSGSNLALQVDQKLLHVLASIGRVSYQTAMQNRAWGNLAILNEWKRRYGDKDPVELHQQFWQDRLLCPGGGEYVWNDEWQTMESTVYGCPAVPKKGPAAPPLLHAVKNSDFGVTFEEQGLRARAKLTR